MIQQKAYKFRFYPTRDQIEQLNREFGHARFVWNHALGLRSKAYRRRGESINYVGLSKHFTHLKKQTAFAWLKDATASCLTQKLIDLDKAFKGFFKVKPIIPGSRKNSTGKLCATSWTSALWRPTIGPGSF
nr:helix-turn-helix domain-containing protein [Methylomarinum sp. Ch1-1]MDP4523157.1 helix-turn-helix domain-containing protein [Methylomarinum sp. Ch1-1]